MADYGNMNRKGITNGKIRQGIGNEGWDTTQSIVEEEWSRQGFVAKDHVCRPVIVDADGRTRPAVVILPAHEKGDGFVTKIETVVERVYGAPVTTTRVEDMKEYTVGDGGRGKPKTQFSDQSSTINEFISSAQTAATGMRGSGFPGGMFQRRKPDFTDYDGTNNSGTNGWTGPSGDIGTHGWSRPSGDIGTNRWSRPTGGGSDFGGEGWSKPGGGRNDTGTNSWSRPIGATNDIGTTRWSKPTDGGSDFGGEGWSKPGGGRNDIGTNGWNRPSGTNIRQPNYEGTFGQNESAPDGKRTTTMPTTDGWSRPSRFGWAAQPSYENPISKPTNDIGAAVELVKESIRPLGPQQVRFSASVPRLPVKEKENVEVIDSREAARRYGGVSAPNKEVTSGSIDAKEAAKKYSGKFIP